MEPLKPREYGTLEGREKRDFVCDFLHEATFEARFSTKQIYLTDVSAGLRASGFRYEIVFPYGEIELIIPKDGEHISIEKKAANTPESKKRLAAFISSLKSSEIPVIDRTENKAPSSPYDNDPTPNPPLPQNPRTPDFRPSVTPVPLRFENGLPVIGSTGLRTRNGVINGPLVFCDGRIARFETPDGLIEINIDDLIFTEEQQRARTRSRLTGYLSPDDGNGGSERDTIAARRRRTRWQQQIKKPLKFLQKIGENRLEQGEG